jgi:hypothetical protein
MGKLPRWTAEMKVVVSFVAADEASADEKAERIESAMRAALVGHRAPTPREYGVPAGNAVVISIDLNAEPGAVMPLEEP